MEWRVPLADVEFGPEEQAAVQEVMQNRWLTMGEVTRQFEQEFAEYTGSTHAVAVTNATAALHLACVALGLGPGDEVIVPSLTFVASANAIRYVGATPVFADIKGKNDWNISIQSIERSITSQTKAIMVVHYGGYPCDMPGILEIARRNNLVIIEDAAHAIGSELNGRKMGTWGNLGCFSFFSNKNMTTGEGGMLVTDDDELAERVRILRSHGMTSMTWDRYKGHAWSYDVVELGYNYRIDEIRSAIGRVQLTRLDTNNSRRRQLTALYRELLQEQVPAISIPFADLSGVSSCHLLPVLLPAGSDRRELMEVLKSKGIQTSIHYPPVHQFQVYRPYYSSSEDLLRMTEEVSSRAVTLPLYPGMSAEAVNYVVRSISEWY